MPYVAALSEVIWRFEVRIQGLGSNAWGLGISRQSSESLKVSSRVRAIVSAFGSLGFRRRASF